MACLALAGFVGSGIAYGEKLAVGDGAAPTHADAALVLAKHYGLFDRYVLPDADLSECVSFLNKHGIYFGLLEVVSGEEFTKKDCARVMGQINLVFFGEAEWSLGKVTLPDDVESWSDFCILNDVPFMETYQSIREFVRLSGKTDRE